MSFEQIFRLLWARRGMILIAAVFSLFAATIVGLILPPRYVAHARVMLNLVKPDPITGESISSQFARAYVRTQTELIRDYRIAGKVVDILGWASSPDLAEQYANRRSDDVRDFRRWMAQRVIDSTNAELIEGSNILDISYTAASPQGAAAVAEAVRRAYIEQAIASAAKMPDAMPNGSRARPPRSRKSWPPPNSARARSSAPMASCLTIRTSIRTSADLLRWRLPLRRSKPDRPSRSGPAIPLRRRSPSLMPQSRRPNARLARTTRNCLT